MHLYLCIYEYISLYVKCTHSVHLLLYIEADDSCHFCVYTWKLRAFALANDAYSYNAYRVRKRILDM